VPRWAGHSTATSGDTGEGGRATLWQRIGEGHGPHGRKKVARESGPGEPGDGGHGADGPRRSDTDDKLHRGSNEGSPRGSSREWGEGKQCGGSGAGHTAAVARTRMDHAAAASTWNREGGRAKQQRQQGA
jgi:hypothetical protein